MAVVTLDVLGAIMRRSPFMLLVMLRKKDMERVCTWPCVSVMDQ